MIVTQICGSKVELMEPEDKVASAIHKKEKNVNETEEKKTETEQPDARNEIRNDEGESDHAEDEYLIESKDTMNKAADSVDPDSEWDGELRFNNRSMTVLKGVGIDWTYLGENDAHS